jgi:hypothetical protein
MPRYFFVLLGPDDQKYDDANGTELAAEADALAHGEEIVSELKEAGGYDDPGWILFVSDESGNEVASLPFNAATRHN